MSNLTFFFFFSFFFKSSVPMKICKTLSLANFLQYFQLTLNDAVSGSVSKVKFCLQLWRLMLFMKQALSHMWTCTLKVTLAVRRGSLKRFNRDHITAFWMRRPVNVIRVLSNMYMFVQWRSHKGIFKHTARTTIKRRANRHWNVYVYIFFFSPLTSRSVHVSFSDPPQDLLSYF